ncbi:MAG: carbamoyltransferase HypF [Deltaproteobacteria bacterium]|nr:carbamoyltransferase HypF [Deltaproteobacteria bacterium]
MAIEVRGLVQGVGYRPFVHGLAARLGLCGQVENTPRGVRIHAEGRPEALESFVTALSQDPPPLARVEEVASAPAATKGISGFAIAPSAHGAPHTSVVPDAAACPDCMADVRRPGGRRFSYPFTNCTNCGPRYTIIRSIPYDRPNTSMRGFAMCPACLAEYQDPANRRFHAQPNACPDCGPRLWMEAGGGRVPGDPLEESARLLSRGGILAIKGLGGFHLAVDATNNQAVLRLRARKNREQKPLAVMARDLDALREFAAPTPKEEELLAGVERPVVLVDKMKKSRLAQAVCPGLSRVGVLLPYTPLHALLLEKVSFPLVMTSGNLAGEPICTGNREAKERLGDIADALLLHDRPIVRPCDDSVARRDGSGTRVLRRSRGYAPAPVALPFSAPAVLAVGGMDKNTVCLTRGGFAYLSQHLGDLESPRCLDAFERTIQDMKTLLCIRPEIVAYDPHPDYPSTRYAKSLSGVRLAPVWHHHAHAAACMAENRVQGAAIALCCDGAGLGPDGATWGGEVLVTDYLGFAHAARLEPLPLAGGDAAARQPWRMALSCLDLAFGTEAMDLFRRLVPGVDEKKARAVLSILPKNSLAPPASSMGRLFDAVAALCGACTENRYQAQAAMELEALAGRGGGEAYACGWQWETMGTALPLSPLVRQVVEDRLKGVSARTVSARFHAALVEGLARVCARVREATGVTQAVLAGGTFQNALLLSGLSERLSEQGFAVFAPSLVPANDGGLSLGQAVVAAARAREDFPCPG